MKVATLDLPVMSSWMERNGRRLDSSPYLSGAMEAKALLDKLPVKKEPLYKITKGGLAGIYHAGREGRLYVDDPTYGIPFLGSTDILAADLSWLPLLAKKQVAAHPSFVIQEGWTLITRSGTIGRMAYVRPAMTGMACSEHVMRVVPDPDKILPGYLYAYLSSRFGVPLVVSGTYGAVIQHIEPHHIAELPIPIPSNELAKEVHGLMQRSAYLLSNYQNLIQRATQILFEKANVESPSRASWLYDCSDLSFAISSAELTTLRAFNYSRRVRRILDQIKSGPWDPIGELVDPSWLQWRKMFQRIDADPEYGIEVITQRPLFQLHPEGRWISRKYLLSHSSRYIVPDLTILIAKQGTLGEDELYCRCEFITGEKMLRRAYSDHCMRLVAMQDRMLPGYLFAFLRSEAGFRILRSISEGSKQQDIHYRTIEKVPIPRCDKEAEIKIHTMILSAYKDRNEAIDLEIKSRNLVEQWLLE